MLRVNSSSVLVVPPFECAWLSGQEVSNESCCISFDAKGDSDATVILKPAPGSRRWQHISTEVPAHAAPVDRQTERNYTVILGSHRNTRLKVEKDGQLCEAVECAPDARLSGTNFTRYWLVYRSGHIQVGTGTPGQGACYTWTDPHPTAGIQHVGLSAWDSHMQYRNIKVGPFPAVQEQVYGPSAGLFVVPEAAQTRQNGVEAASLQQLCLDAARRQLQPSTVCSILQVAEMLRPLAETLRMAALEFLAGHLEAVVLANAEGLTWLPTPCLLDLLAHPALDCKELLVWEVVVRWAQYGAEPGHSGSVGHKGFWREAAEVEKALPLIRFPLMSEADLHVVSAHPLARSCRLLTDLLAEARASHADAARAEELQAKGSSLLVEDVRHVRLQASAAEAAAATRFQRRHSPACQELMYVSDGDRNGVCHFLGRACGTRQWVNPVSAGTIKVRASSPACRTTDPRGLVDGRFLRANWAGPRLEGGAPSTWWLLDLGPANALVCNYYTLRHDGSANFLRSWALQGSRDSEHWTTLRSHVNDTSISMPGQYASWPVFGHAASLPYRAFRLLLIGPSASDPHTLALSNLELYGYLFRASDSV